MIKLKKWRSKLIVSVVVVVIYGGISIAALASLSEITRTYSITQEFNPIVGIISIAIISLLLWVLWFYEEPEEERD